MISEKIIDSSRNKDLVESNCWTFIKTRNEKTKKGEFHLVYAFNRRGENVKILRNVSLNHVSENEKYVHVAQKATHNILLSKDNNSLSIQRSDVMREYFLDHTVISVDKIIALSRLIYEL